MSRAWSMSATPVRKPKSFEFAVYGSGKPCNQALYGRLAIARYRGGVLNSLILEQES